MRIASLFIFQNFVYNVVVVVNIIYTNTEDYVASYKINY